jgi:hypothetical protein
MGDGKENKINFLDITISKEESNILFNIYRKPTTKDTITRNNSCHPQDHKLAAIRYLTNRMQTYNLNVNNKVKEANTIQQILYNKYDPSLLNNHAPLTNNTKTDLNKTKWAKFTHVGKETKFITKLFKHTTLNVAIKTQNTIGKLLSQQNNRQQEKYEKCGVYKPTFPDRNKKYIGQIG